MKNEANVISAVIRRYPSDGWEWLAANLRYQAGLEHKYFVAVRASYLSNSQRLHECYPHWASSEGPNSQITPRDARLAFFTTAQSIFRNRQFAFLLVKEQLTDKNWWIRETGNFDIDYVVGAVNQWITSTQLFTFHQLFSLAEMTLRTIIKAEPSILSRKRPNFRNLYTGILIYSGIQGYEPFFEIMRLVRNTIHNNGIYVPDDSNRCMETSVTYQKRTFKFESGKPPETMDLGALCLISDWLNEAMYSIVASDNISSIGHCPITFRVES